MVLVALNEGIAYVDDPSMEATGPEPGSTRQPGASDSVRIQILATEHWSLLAQRGMIWNETFSRATMFLTTLSAATVSLALVAQATNFGDDFSTFALLVLSLVLMVGIWTLVRLGNVADEDIWLVVGMNRLRHAYIDLAPDLEQYFVASHYDDAASVIQTWNPTNPSRLTRILSSTPGIVGVINAALVGVIVALAVEFFDYPPQVHAIAGVAGMLAAGAVMVVMIPHRQISRFERNLQPRFPRQGETWSQQ
jgi:hypothetical protein